MVVVVSADFGRPNVGPVMAGMERLLLAERELVWLADWRRKLTFLLWNGQNFPFSSRSEGSKV